MTDKHSAYLRSLTDPRRMDAVRDEAERINREWRERTPERRKVSDAQFDHTRDLDERGLTPMQGYSEDR